jgi:DNA-binding response OmpR family regulator
MRILIVEDNVALAKGIKTSLVKLCYSVDHFETVAHALHATSQESYDLIILDLGLPDADGLTFLNEFRQQHQTPVIILTARDGIEHKIKGLDLGADDYLLKPFDQTELQARMRALLRRSHGAASNKIEFGDLIIDINSREVHFRGKAVSLSRREFSLLEVLVQNDSKVMSRNALQQTLYSWDNEIESNTMEVHIHNLRKKLDKKIIKTIRGIGYMAVKC